MSIDRSIAFIPGTYRMVEAKTGKEIDTTELLARYNAQLAERDAALARVAQLEAALRPIAAAWNEDLFGGAAMMGQEFVLYETAITSGKNITLPVSALRDAAALSAKETTP